MQRLLPYLPDGSAEAAECLLINSSDLDGLLSSDTPELWSAVRTDASIVAFLESYLRNAVRPFDDGFRELSDIEHAVWRHAAVLFSKLLAARGGGIPAHADRVALLSRLLNVPCLLDACSLFSTAFDDLSPCAAAISGMFSLRPTLRSDVTTSASSIAENLSQVVDACLEAAPAARKDPDMLKNVIDGVAYVRDACLSLCALLRVYPPAAGYLLKNGAELVEALGAVHDHLLPSTEDLAAIGRSSSGGGVLGASKDLSSQLGRHSLQLEVACEVAVASLLRNAFLEPDIEGAGSSSSSAGSSVSSRKKYNPVAINKGEALLNALTLLGHRESNSSSAVPSRGGGLSLGPALAQHHGLAGAIQASISAGVVSLDDAQSDYIAALMDVPSLAEAPFFPSSEVGSGSGSAAVHAGPAVGGAGISSSSGNTGAVTSSSSGITRGPDVAVVLSLVSQVRDLLPDLGEGFVALCLEALGNSPEKAINALLEGNLPAEVQKFDRQMSFKQYEAMRQPKEMPAVPEERPSDVRPTPQQQAQRRLDDMTAKYLDAKETMYAQKVKAAAVESQWEYDDEYDDSFDELLHIGADGVAEGEGEEESNTDADAVGAATHSMQNMNLNNPSTGGRGGRGGGGGGKPRGKGGKFWILDGRIYNYAKPGAKEVASEADAQAAVRQAQQAAMEIHGLGPGGNVPMQPQQQQQQTPRRGGEPGGSSSSRNGGNGEASSSASTNITNTSTSGQGEARAGPSDMHGGRGGRGGPSAGGRGRGGGRGRESSDGGEGGGRGGGGRGPDHKWKDKNKAAVGNHHRKDRAAQKMSRGMQ